MRNGLKFGRNKRRARRGAFSTSARRKPKIFTRLRTEAPSRSVRSHEYKLADHGGVVERLVGVSNDMLELKRDEWSGRFFQRVITMTQLPRASEETNRSQPIRAIIMRLLIARDDIDSLRPDGLLWSNHLLYIRWCLVMMRNTRVIKMCYHPRIWICKNVISNIPIISFFVI